MKYLFTFLLAGLMSSSVFSDDYLVISHSNKFSKTFQASVAKSGGKIPMLIEEIGVARVTAGPDFSMKNATVLPDVHVNMLPPEQNFVSGVDAANPPFSGDDDFFFDLQWGHDAINAPEAWDAGIRGQGVRVAVLDSGFDIDHPDLAPNINFGLSTDFTGEGLAYGLADTFSHGSHTAGTIAAADNAFGTIGVAPEAELMLVKVLADSGSGSFGDVMAGIVYAGLNGADVINMSLGADIPQGLGIDAAGVAMLRIAMNRAINFAYQQGAAIMVSAGNDARDLDKDQSMVVFPADMPNAISISATGPTNWASDPSTNLDGLAIYSNYGRSSIDFAAPGGDYHSAFTAQGNQGCSLSFTSAICYAYDFVFSTGNNGWYWSVGTSMAAPHASGVAALIISENGGNMHPAQLKAEMKRRSTDLGQPGKDPAYGAGRVSTGF